MRLKFKLPLVAVLPGLVIISIFFTTRYVIERQKTDALVINLAGRQRMLSQKMNKELYAVLMLRSRSEDVSGTVEDLRWSMELFDKTLEALSKGIAAPISIKKEDNVLARCPVPSHAVLSVLDSTAKRWVVLRGSIEELLGTDTAVSGLGKTTQVGSIISEILTLSNRATDILQTESEKRSSNLLLIQLLGLFVGLVCIVWAIRTSAGALGKISSINKLVEQFSLGNLTDRAVVIKSIDELDNTLVRVNSLGESIAVIVSEIYAANSTLMKVSEDFSAQFEQIADNAETVKSRSNTVAAASEQASSSVNSISAGAEEMSASVSSVANAMEQMSLSINEVARSCVEESRIASETDSQVRVTQGVISQLGIRAREIGRIVDVIADIADKTNLLALNAAIEAASAGAAGKGFSVVANEVKELARQTAKSTGEIREQIENVQSDVSQSVQAIGIITDLIDKVNRISQTIVAAVEEQSVTSNEVARSISGASEAAISIARNVSETASGIAEVSFNIQNVNSETIGVADNIMSSRIKVKELKELGHNLQQIVSAFRISGKLIEWSSQFSVGVDKMDDQHKKLIAMINSLNDALGGGKARETVGVILGELLAYTETHFTQEEAFMRSGGYGELDGHIKIHRSFTEKISELKGQYEQGTAMISKDVMLFLKDWLINHIAKMDKRYGAVLGKKRM